MGAGLALRAAHLNRRDLSLALQAKLAKLGLDKTPEEFVAELEPPIKRRVEALQGLQSKHDELEAQFRKERAELEAKYEKLYGKLCNDWWFNGLCNIRWRTLSSGTWGSLCFAPTLFLFLPCPCSSSVRRAL